MMAVIQIMINLWNKVLVMLELERKLNENINIYFIGFK